MLKMRVSRVSDHPFKLVFRTIVFGKYWATYYETRATARLKMFRHVAVHIAQMQDFAPKWIKNPVLRVYMGGVVYYTIYAYYALFSRKNNPFEVEAEIIQNSHQFNRYMSKRVRFAEFKKFKLTRNEDTANRRSSN